MAAAKKHFQLVNKTQPSFLAEHVLDHLGDIAFRDDKNFTEAEQY